MKPTKRKLYIEGRALAPLELVSKIARLNRRLDSYRRRLGLEYDVPVKITGVDTGGPRVEDSGTYVYPTTLEVKIEARSNRFYSVRVVDGVWVPEGRSLSGPGRSLFQVYRSVLRELAEHAADIKAAKQGGQP